MADSGIIVSLGAALIFLGTCIIALAIFMLAFKKTGKRDVRGGGVVIIGPIPIVFGTDKKVLRTVLLLSIVLTLLLLVVMIVNYLLR